MSKTLLTTVLLVTTTTLTAAKEEEPRGLSALELMGGLKILEIKDIESQAAATVPEFIAPELSTRPTLKLADASLVASERVISDQGRSITIQRLFKAPLESKPVLKAVSASSSGISNLKSEISGEAASRKPHHTLFLSITVYDHSLSRVRWFREGGEYQAWVNFDFTLLRGLGRFETETADYSLVLGIGEDSLSDQILSVKQPSASSIPGPEQSEVPPLAGFTLNRVIIHPAPSNPPGIHKTTEYQALPDLIAHLQAHESEIRWNQAIQKAENAARQRWLKANPPQPQNVVIQFWPIKNPVLPAATR